LVFVINFSYEIWSRELLFSPTTLIPKYKVELPRGGPEAGAGVLFLLSDFSVLFRTFSVQYICSVLPLILKTFWNWF
jgi:hypothetical protein